MLCESFETQLVTFAAGREPGSAALAAHLLGCSVCRARLDDERRLSRALRGLAEEWRATPIPDGIERSVVEKLRARARAPGFRAAPAHRARWRTLGPTARVGAVAAMLVICLSVLIGRMSRVTEVPAQVAARQAPAAVVAPEITTRFYRVQNRGTRVARNPGLVRVQVPRATLAMFGLPYNPRLAREPITAELLVDNVGAVTAMRFVQ